MNEEENLLRQHSGEPIDFFAMRAFLVALGRVDENVARAMICWIYDKGFSDLRNRRDRRFSVEFKDYGGSKIKGINKEPPIDLYGHDAAEGLQKGKTQCSD